MRKHGTPFQICQKMCFRVLQMIPERKYFIYFFQKKVRKFSIFFSIFSVFGEKNDFFCKKIEKVSFFNFCVKGTRTIYKHIYWPILSGRTGLPEANMPFFDISTKYSYLHMLYQHVAARPEHSIVVSLLKKTAPHIVFYWYKECKTDFTIASAYVGKSGGRREVKTCKKSG